MNTENQTKRSLFNVEMVILLVVMVVSAYMLLASNAFHNSQSRLFPQIVATATLLLCGVQVISNVRKYLKEKTQSAAAAPAKKTGAVRFQHLIILGIAVAYMLLLQPVGFVLCTLAVTAGIPYVLGYKRMWVLAILSVVFTMVLYIVFKHVFFIPLPQGILTFL